MWEAVHCDDDSLRVAIKVFDLNNVKNWNGFDLLFNEAATLRELSIDGVPRYHDFISLPPMFFLVQCYIDAPSLQARLDNGFRPLPDAICDILRQLATILVELHERDVPIIHRDIKPGNILINDDNRVWLIDFGIVADDLQESSGSTMAGTVGYMAPEQLVGEVSPAADMYSLGATMAYLFSGVAPGKMETKGLMIDLDKYLSDSTPSWFRQIIADLLNPYPEKRLSSARQLLRRLENDRKLTQEELEATYGVSTNAKSEREKRRTTVSVERRTQDNIFDRIETLKERKARVERLKGMISGFGTLILIVLFFLFLYYTRGK